MTTHEPREALDRFDPPGMQSSFAAGCPADAGFERRLGRLASHLGALLFRRRDALAIRHLRRQVAERDARLRDAEAALARARSTFDRATSAARIGMWECSLPDETLSWSGGTFDIFDLPHGHALRRRDALEFYARSSLATLQAVRSRAIETGTGFALDTELVTARGTRRFMRVTATVDTEDGRPARIFGLKQDITEEKLLLERAHHLAAHDAMTGLANRTRFEASLEELCALPAETPLPGALLLVDLDGFKTINDTHGHAAGDRCLKEAARRLAHVCREADIVARIGGDEFGVVVAPGRAPAEIEALATRIAGEMAAPVSCDGLDVAFGASVGVAPALGCAPAELFARADAALYSAKGAGRSTFRTFEAA